MPKDSKASFEDVINKFNLLSITFVLICKQSRIYEDSGSSAFRRLKIWVWKCFTAVSSFFAFSLELKENTTFTKGLDSALGILEISSLMKLLYGWLVGPTVISISPFVGESTTISGLCPGAAVASSLF